jgi:AGZA family xanthine/uracil permease-like MFS transporter
MKQIISVNSSILSDAGGPCVCDSTPDDPICITNIDYNMCKQELRRDYVVATSCIALIATFTMGLFANMPLGLAPGLGVNAYFAYSQVGFNVRLKHIHLGGRKADQAGYRTHHLQ